MPSALTVRRPASDLALPTARPLHVGVFSYRLPVVGQKRGGIERVAHDLAEGLARRGHAVTVFSHDPRPAGASYAVVPLPWRRLVETWIGRRLTMGYLGNLLWLHPPLADFDVLLAHGDSLLLPLRGKPFIRVMHGSAWGEAASATSPGRFVLQAGVCLQELASAALHAETVAVSENARASNRFVRRVIPNGVDRRVFHPAAGHRAVHPTLVFVGALNGRKRGNWLLDAFEREILRAIPAAHLHMVCAPGPVRRGVTYHEGVPDAELADLYCRAWLCVSPSTYEGFGLPYAEALACGTPVVATPNAGSLEVLRGGGGVLVEDGSFASAIVRLLGHAEERAALASDARARAGEFDLERTLDAYESLMRSMAATSRTAG
jgi:phosphatidylinositol alpha-mannosyltransferase